jgi:hypothetical protein
MQKLINDGALVTVCDNWQTTHDVGLGVFSWTQGSIIIIIIITVFTIIVLLTPLMFTVIIITIIITTIRLNSYKNTTG